jgi:hypothetical protein
MKWHDLLARLPVQGKRLKLVYSPDEGGWSFSIDGTPPRQVEGNCEYAILRGLFEYLIRDKYTDMPSASE